MPTLFLRSLDSHPALMLHVKSLLVTDTMDEDDLHRILRSCLHLEEMTLWMSSLQAPLPLSLPIRLVVNRLILNAAAMSVPNLTHLAIHDAQESVFKTILSIPSLQQVVCNLIPKPDTFSMSSWAMQLEKTLKTSSALQVVIICEDQQYWPSILREFGGQNRVTVLPRGMGCHMFLGSSRLWDRASIQTQVLLGGSQLDVPKTVDFNHLNTSVGSLLVDRYVIIRKLGAGINSSTWLVRDSVDNRYYGVKVLTLDASTKHKDHESSIGKLTAHLHDDTREFPRYYGAFNHHSSHGVHHCFLMDMYGPPVRLKIPDPIDFPFVMAVIGRVIEQLERLHSLKLVHTAISLDNLVFDDTEDVQSAVSREPAAIHESFDFDAFQNQPLRLKNNWKSGVNRTYDLYLQLTGLCHARKECDIVTLDHFLPGRCPPEVRNGGHLSTKVDIWLVGCLTLELLLGTHEFPTYPSEAVETISKLFAACTHFLDHDHVQMTNVPRFIARCLDPDPLNRPSAQELLGEPWGVPVFGE